MDAPLQSTLQVVNVISSAVAALTALILIIPVYRRSSSDAARWFIALLICAVWVNALYVFEALAGADLQAYVSLSKLEYIGLAFIPMTWLGFAYAFNDPERALNQRTTTLLAVIPVVTFSLALTNEYHGLIWATPRFIYDTFPPSYEPRYGLGFWIFIIYSYALFLVGTILLLGVMRRTWKLYRLQAVLILLGMGTPWISNLSEIFNLTPLPGFNMNAFSLGTGLLFLALAVLRLKLFDVPPMTYPVILESVPDALIVIDQDNRLLAFNSAAERYAAAPLQKAVGKSIASSFPRLYPEIVALAANDSARIAFSGRWLEVRRREITSGGSLVRGHLLIITDVTEREAYLQQSILLMREQERVQALSKLITIVSHDFRTPLSVIGTSAYLLWRTQQLERREEHYTAIVAQIRTFDSMLHNLLDIVRLTVDNAPLVPATVAPNALVTAALDHCRALLSARSLKLETHLAADLPSVEVDDAALATALKHLLQNAIEHTASDGTITVATRCESDGVILEVTDTGVGIASEHLPRIFEPFYRVDEARTLSKGGSGLGLAVVKRIAELSGGHVMVDSLPGVGSRFSIWLPALSGCIPLAPMPNRGSSDESPASQKVSDLAI